MHTREPTSSHCAACEVELTLHRREAGFCCTGCAQGGPCTCSYDDVPGSGITDASAALISPVATVDAEPAGGVRLVTIAIR